MKVIIEVERGFATVMYKTKGVKLIIVDKDVKLRPESAAKTEIYSSDFEVNEYRKMVIT